MLYPQHKDHLKDTTGRYRTQSLFWEYRHTTDMPPLWTLKESGCALPSLKDLYLSHLDPTEYSFAMDAFGSWAQWLRISENKVILKEVQQWRDELEVKVRSEGLRAVISEAQGGKAQFNAAKFLAKADWKGTSKGRPSKDEIARNLKVETRLADSVDNDAQRLGLKLVK